LIGSETSPRIVWLTAAATGLGFALAWAIVAWLGGEGLYGSPAGVFSVRPYPDYGAAILAGSLPYRDLTLDYPPLSIPAFVIPSLLGGTGGDTPGYRAAFQALMLGCGVGLTMLVAMAASLLGGSRRDVFVAAGFAAASPLLIGPIMLTRFDLWPAVLATASVVSILMSRHRMGFAFLGLAILAKDYPALLAPILVTYVWKRSGRRAAAEGVLYLGAVVAVGFAPFLWLGGGGVVGGLAHAIQRPLQIETLGATLIVLAHDLAGVPVHRAGSFGSVNLIGALPAALAAAQSLALIALLLATWIGFARGRPSPSRMTVGVAATLCSYVALGKVLSPQYLIWLIPAIAILGGRERPIAMAALGASLLLTSVEWPRLAADYGVHLALVPAGILFIRDLVLCGLAGWLVLRLYGTRPSPEANRDPIVVRAVP
jgi:hypothetical protein